MYLNRTVTHAPLNHGGDGVFEKPALFLSAYSGENILIFILCGDQNELNHLDFQCNRVIIKQSERVHKWKVDVQAATSNDISVSSTLFHPCFMTD